MLTVETTSKTGRGNITIIILNTYPPNQKYFHGCIGIAERMTLLFATEFERKKAHNNKIFSIIEELGAS